MDTTGAPTNATNEIAGRLDVGDVSIAYRHAKGSAPGLMWLGGYRSDMTGTKAEVLAAHAAQNGLQFTRHDYSGHGLSGGEFADGTISLWLAQSLAVLDQVTEGPQILVGSSMGGWITLRMVQELNRRGDRGRIAGLLLIAPAPDFTSDLMQPLLSRKQKEQIETLGYLEEPSQYSDQPNIYTRALFEDGEQNRVLTGLIDTHCPVTIIQGMADPDVPHSHALKLVEHLPADNVTLSLVPDGDHRLSRPQDLDLITRSVSSLVEQVR
ncbi:alpha/beta hydrolase [Tianweitania sp. BSSL-BM11]|uniref:Palmitoyl-protein thioesterase ABHD10, mitochondrial n=1 Tax=Tianweitania aestuarii TaxID=2814886 RepID=A0ABS5RXC3_9HYPH|nr:alpha/beta hydrolase [Tianweitania aestuarii]MBS9721689.1 alpha/beta hydrolase [Tianweitania aestuarii]